MDTSVIQALSERELEVLRLLARGLSNADIAVRLYLSEEIGLSHLNLPGS